MYVLRWNFFSYIVDPKLDPRFLEEISDENLYMVIQLYTIQHEHKEPLMTKREIMAFIIMHFRLKSMTEVERLKFVTRIKKEKIIFRPRAVHLATIYTHSFVKIISQCVGNVIACKHFLVCNNFEGEIFQYLYNKFQDCDDLSKCFKNSTEETEAYIYYRNVTSNESRVKIDWYDY